MRRHIPQIIPRDAVLSGSMLAAFVLIAMSADPAGAATAIGPWGVTAALIFEVVATFIFVTVILGATQDGHTTPVAGLAIGLTLTMIHLAGISVTGVSVNPARAIASNVFDAGAASQLWLYILAPLVGGAFAGLLHKAGVTQA